MKLLKILKEVMMTPAMTPLIYKLEDAGWRRVGSGDWGIVLEKGEKVKKITTDSLEIEDALALQGHNSPYIIPILNVEKLADNLAIIDMPNAQELDNAEKDMIYDAEQAAEDYIVYGKENALENTPEPMKDFIVGVKKGLMDAGVDLDNLDWSPYNVMKYNGKYVLIDV